MSNGSTHFQKYTNTNQRHEEEDYEMKLFTIFMVLAFLFVGMLGFGSINEFEIVGTVDALNIYAVSADGMLDSVAPQRTKGLELLDVQAMIAVTGLNDYSRIMLLSTYSIDGMNALSIYVTNGLVIPEYLYGLGNRNRYILPSPFKGQ
jgi:hypothetical protein